MLNCIPIPEKSLYRYKIYITFKLLALANKGSTTGSGGNGGIFTTL